MSTTETFHLFPYLPWELRAMIWEFTVAPRMAFTEILSGTSDFQRKYVWINWEHDTIRAGMTELRHFRYESIQTSIQRLDIEILRLLPGEIKILQGFVKLKKLDIHGEIWNFRWAFRLFPFACGQKNIILHDMLDFLTLDSFDWDELWDDLWDEDIPVYD
ncbi:hypothetical protein NEUTE1DRAFT_99984 [Neurospora tetrasperma FGSC 2508]|uniref:2EXR domain-containing protein n=1 Tax=Neurospora tetrasperma (strain FGSC 2508 / ATCC MYA-4615 / P0657) TaxID=510951 RepID=F8MIN8_NEUT8|nr:uncharacterized protein NEUTE1DRAFT_99984 [Neurospora tetrasperma FGSC 2508]EGO59839.1 hypothetical protein NEUTE1DRAFT_99984 [Neurospora tetrasperma FGSC 2508]EGZ73988.1 hypothetical protein NEUTE2DRAFT_61075 [Neurospora tetrasperma FGSC 2509]